ncbi:MAG: hypothetical protein R2710_29835 [Acidimicrobiales bacterium]
MRFLIVTDPAKKAQLAEWYMIPWSAYFELATSSSEAIQAESGDAKATKTEVLESDRARRRRLRQNLANHPAIIVALADLAATHPTDTDLGRLSIVGGASVTRSCRTCVWPCATRVSPPRSPHCCVPSSRR